VAYVAPLHKPCVVICNTCAACRFCSFDHGFGALSKLQFQCLNVDWNDTLFLRDLWIIAWIDEINLSSVYCKSSSSIAHCFYVTLETYSNVSSSWFTGNWLVGKLKYGKSYAFQPLNRWFDKLLSCHS
jgi:hypothetical protein